jgi:hypothetical protein
MNDINEALFCNRLSEFTQTKRMVHRHIPADESCIGRSGGNMTMGMVIAVGGTAMVRKSLSEYYSNESKNLAPLLSNSSR